jgi:hypothetical protein
MINTEFLRYRGTQRITVKEWKDWNPVKIPEKIPKASEYFVILIRA